MARAHDQQISAAAPVTQGQGHSQPDKTLATLTRLVAQRVLVLASDAKPYKSYAVTPINKCVDRELLTHSRW
jgi:hypothetical protein